MTTIIGVQTEVGAWIGADSGVFIGSCVLDPVTTKVFANGPLLFANSGSVRVRDLVQYALQPPRPHADVEPQAYVVLEVVPRLQALVKDAGLPTPWDGALLVAFQGRVFALDSDYSVSPVTPVGGVGYAVRGNGMEVAMGALASLGGDPVPRIEAALRATALHNAFTRPPFTVMHQARP